MPVRRGAVLIESALVPQVAAFGVSSFGSSLIHNLHQLQLPLLSPASPSSALAPQSSEELALLNQRLHTRLNTVMQPEGAPYAVLRYCISLRDLPVLLGTGSDEISRYWNGSGAASWY
eukprot:3717253-Rhodomonas_salina.3